MAVCGTHKRQILNSGECSRGNFRVLDQRQALIIKLEAAAGWLGSARREYSSGKRRKNRIQYCNEDG